MNDLVSILIPVYNRESIIAETIKSALEQTYQNIEIVIVDNASTDNTWNVIQNFAKNDQRIRTFKNEYNLGPVRNWLRCVEESNGIYGKILWSDDLISKNFVEKTLQLFNNDVGFVYTGVNFFTDNCDLDSKTNYLLAKTDLYPSTIFIERAIFDKNVPVSPGCAIFRMVDIKKNLYLQVPNQVKSDFSMHAIGNDLLLFLLTARSYKCFGHIAEPLSFFREHEGSISITSKNGRLSLHYAMVKAYFVERYYPKLVPSLASYIQLLLWQFKDSSNYGLNSVNDFFERNVAISKILILKILLNKVGRYFFRILKRFNLKIS